MGNFTFLEEEQIFNKPIEVIEKRGTKAAITDFSILLGGYVDDDYHVDGKNGLEDRTGYYWTRSDDGYNDARAVSIYGFRYGFNVDERNLACRPALPFSRIGTIPTNGESGKRARDGVIEIEYGYYPQKAVSKAMQTRLERAKNSMNRTGNSYTTDSRRYTEYSQKFSGQKHIEYEFEGKRYVRVKANSCFDGQPFKLSNGEEYKDGDYVWIEVEPIKWLVDEKAKLMITEKLVFAGVQFNHERNYRTQNFGKTDVKQFMDTYFEKEIQQNRGLEKQEAPKEQVGEEIKTRKQNPYNFNFDMVEEEEIIKGAVESGIAVFLHGSPGDGKSARVEQLDPDCEVLYLRNASPESLNGKSAYNSVTGKMIDIKPTWLERLEEKCQKEQDKIHILFLDEITNAPETIQGMAFNIVLQGEVNGKWKLPENARIVAAGNDVEDSVAAYELAEPLYGRFAHVKIETTAASWLKWAVTPKSEYQRLDYKKQEKPKTPIHPAIYAYIAYKANKGEEALRTKYTGKKPNADPRKWEMASKILYETKKPEMLRALVGEELTAEFIAFTKQQVLTVSDVVSGNYTREDLDMDISEQYATAVGLSIVDEKNIESVRNFISKLEGEVRATFDNLWAGGDEKRLEKIVELQLKQQAEASRKNTRNQGGMDR